MGDALRFLSLLLVLWPGIPQQNDPSVRGRQILDQAIQALGGQAYLSLRDYRAEGRGFSFDHWERITGMSPILELDRLPDKYRQAQGKNHDYIVVVNGDRGWDSSYRGVAPLPAADIERIRLGRKLSFDVVLRFRLTEPGSEVLYTGTDFVDGQLVDIVEFSDADRNVVKLAIARDSHLPVRREWERKLPNSEREQNLEILTKYHSAKGGIVQFPFYIGRQRNGIKVSEFFIEEIDTNHRLDDSMFERPPGPERIDVPSRKSK
jgi:hypothetical protein